MMPFQINKAIKSGEIWYAPGPQNYGLGAIILKAKSKDDKVFVQTQEHEWLEVTEIRKAGEAFTTAVFAIGDLTWHSN